MAPKSKSKPVHAHALMVKIDPKERTVSASVECGEFQAIGENAPGDDCAGTTSIGWSRAYASAYDSIDWSNQAVLADGIYRVERPHFVAHFVIEGGRVVACAPILRRQLARWMREAVRV